MPREITAFWGGGLGLWSHCLPVVRTVPNATIAIASLGASCTPTLVCWKDAAGAFCLLASVGYGPYGLSVSARKSLVGYGASSSLAVMISSAFKRLLPFGVW